MSYCLLYILKRCLNTYTECGNDGFLVLDLVVCESISFFLDANVFLYMEYLLLNIILFRTCNAFN